MERSRARYGNVTAHGMARGSTGTEEGRGGDGWSWPSGQRRAERQRATMRARTVWAGERAGSRRGTGARTVWLRRTEEGQPVATRLISMQNRPREGQNRLWIDLAPARADTDGHHGPSDHPRSGTILPRLGSGQWVDSLTFLVDLSRNVPSVTRVFWSRLGRRR